MFKEHEMVTMKRSIDGIPVGSAGTVVHVYKEGLAYEVEFPARKGGQPLSVDEADISPMPKKGDKLYRVWNGNLETAVFISVMYNGEHKDKMKYPSFCCHKSGQPAPKGGDGYVFICSPEMYMRTELEAWMRYEKECCEAETSCGKAVEEAEKQLDYVRNEEAKALENIRRLTMES
jgi:hypothetical protein